MTGRVNIVTDVGTPQDRSSTDGTAAAVAAVIVLAAGQGTRMRSAIPKVLHPLAGRPLLWHAIRAAAALGPRQVVSVIGHGREQVQDFLSGATDLAGVPLSTALQTEQLGTGHAVQCALDRTGTLAGTVIVTYGDVPLLRAETLRRLAEEHARAGNAVTVLTARVDDPTGYGRIVRSSDGTVRAIVEHRDADAATLAIGEINSGVYAFDGKLLADALQQVGSSNAQGERYLTDVVTIAVRDGRRVGSVMAADAEETEGVNDRVQLARLARRLNDRLVREAQLDGVTIHDPATTWLHADVRIGSDTELLPGTHLQAGTRIGSGCHIGPDTTLIHCTVDDDATVLRSHCHDAHIGAGAQVGPYTHLRPGSDIGSGAQVGAFVEVKKTTVGDGAKAHHLAYLGDAAIGAGANIGAGVITANYDGVRKSVTQVGAHTFIGSNSTLVAPVEVADGSYVAAGSTVTDNVAAGDLAVARGRQHNSAGWVARRRAGTPSDTAARQGRERTDDDGGSDDGPGGPDDDGGSDEPTARKDG